MFTNLGVQGEISLFTLGKKLNSVTSIRERAIPTKRPLVVGEVSANFCGYKMSCGQRHGFLRL
jgi:hypothetical protein